MENTLDMRPTQVWRDRRAIALLMAASLTTMANATISPALPGLERLFADDANAAMLTRLLVPAPALSVALCAPFAGLLADRCGRRAMMLGGTVLFVIAGCAGLVLPDLPTIFASRIVLGVAVALIMTAQTALVGDYFAGADRNALTGLQISARNFGGFVFISLAGWVATISPRLPFAIYGLAAVFLPVMWTAIVDPVRPDAAAGRKPTDLIADPPGWRTRLGLVIALQGLTNMLFFLMPTQLAFFLEARGYNSAIITGTALGALMLSGGGFALLYPRIQPVTGVPGTFALGYGVMALGFVLLSLAASEACLLAATAAIGAGYALVSPGFITLALGLAPLRHRGLAGGMLTASIFIGQFCSPVLSTPLITAFGFDAVLHATALVLVALVLLVVIVGAIGTSRRGPALAS